MTVATLHFRAYRDPRLPSRCAERAAAWVAKWLQAGDYALTSGPPQPFGNPQNLIPPADADALQHRLLVEHAPLYLWRYPLVFRFQLWQQGWDIAVLHRLLHTGTPQGVLEVRRRFLHSALQGLIIATEPRLLVGPLEQKPPPAHLTQALRELPTWQLWYLDPVVAERTPWAQLLHRPGKRTQLYALSTGGLLVQQLA